MSRPSGPSGRGRGGMGRGGLGKKPLEGIQFVKPTKAPSSDQPPSLMNVRCPPSAETPRPLLGNSAGRGAGLLAFPGPSGGNSYRMPGSVSLNKPNSPKTLSSLPSRKSAEPVLTKLEYMDLWQKETDPELKKFRKLAYEVVNLKVERPNATDRIHSAANRVPIRTMFNTEPAKSAKGTSSFVCYVSIEGISVATGQGVKIKDAKMNAYENALQKVYMPYLRIYQVDPETRQLQASREPFTGPPPPTSQVPMSSNKVPQFCQVKKESNLKEAGMKRRLYNEFKPLEEFVIVEPKHPIPDCTSAHTLRRSADFNHMLLEHEFFFLAENSVKCVLRIENQVLAEATGYSKVIAKNQASIYALDKMKEICWVIKTKQATDAEEGSKISKDEMLNELSEQSDVISNDNVGNKLLRKMGWSGGGIGKDGSGIEEPVSLKSVMNREGLGLGTTKGITAEFTKKINDLIEDYAVSDNPEDLVFSSDFRLEERQVIHDVCRKFNLKSKSRGKGVNRYLCVRRKRTANELFNHLMAVGGETRRYELVPPSKDGGSYSSSMTNNPGPSGQVSQGFNPQGQGWNQRGAGSFGPNHGDPNFDGGPRMKVPNMGGVGGRGGQHFGSGASGVGQNPNVRQGGQFGVGMGSSSSSLSSGFLQGAGDSSFGQRSGFGAQGSFEMGSNWNNGNGMASPNSNLGYFDKRHNVTQWSNNATSQDCGNFSTGANGQYVQQDVERWAHNARDKDISDGSYGRESHYGTGNGMGWSNSGPGQGGNFFGGQGYDDDSNDGSSVSSGSSSLLGNRPPGLLDNPGMWNAPAHQRFDNRGYGQNNVSRGWQNNNAHHQGRGGFSQGNARGQRGRQW